VTLQQPKRSAGLQTGCRVGLQTRTHPTANAKSQNQSARRPARSPNQDSTQALPLPANLFHTRSCHGETQATPFFRRKSRQGQRPRTRGPAQALARTTRRPAHRPPGQAQTQTSRLAPRRQLAGCLFRPAPVSHTPYAVKPPSSGQSAPPAPQSSAPHASSERMCSSCISPNFHL